MGNVRRVTGSQQGVAMVMALVTVLMLATLTIGITNLALTEYATALTVDQGIQAFSIADAAVERGLAVLRTDLNWGDGAGVDAQANILTWRPLLDAGVEAVNRPYPTAVSPVGTYSVYLRRPSAAEGIDATHNIWIRVLGRSGRAGRSIELLAHRLTPLDFMAYSAEAVKVDQGGGNVTIHGSAYFREDLGLKAVKTGLYNDRAISSGDAEPYRNEVMVKGTLDMSTGNSTLGTEAQPMFGVHALRINLKNDGKKNLWTYSLTNTVPDIAYPNVQAYIDNLLASDGYGNRLNLSETSMIICTKPAAGGSWSTQTVSDLVLDDDDIVVVPRKTYLTCDDGVTAEANYLMHWQPSAIFGQSGTLVLNSTYKSEPVYVPGIVDINQDLRFQGVATVVVQKSGGGTYGLDASGGQILARERASESASCGATNPTTMPRDDLLGFIVVGSVLAQGSNGNACRQEQNLVLVVGTNVNDTVVSNFKAQFYGMVVAKKLDTSQNPDFYQVTDLSVYLPSPLALLMTYNVTLPVVVKKWREILD